MLNESEKEPESQLRKLVAKFERTGSVANDVSNYGRLRSAKTEESITTIKNTITEFPTTSQRRLSAKTNIPESTIQRILKKDLHLKPFIPGLIHQLIEDDFDRQVQFCEELIALNAEDPNFVDNIWWSDESTFKLSGVVNRHNSESLNKLKEIIQCCCA